MCSHKMTQGIGYLIFVRMFPTPSIKPKLSSRSLEIDPQGLAVYQMKHA